MRGFLILALLGCGSTPAAKADAPVATGWRVVSTSFDQPLTGSWVSGADVFFVGYQASSFHSNDGQTFTAVPLNAGTSHGTRAWGMTATDVYATGFSGKMVHSSDRAASWQSVTTGTTSSLYAMWSTAGSFYVVGDDTVLHSADGASWQAQTPPPLGTHISGVWGSSASDIYVAGDLGLAHSTGDGTWTKQASAPPNLVNVWGSGPNDIYAVGPGIYHSDGTGAWVQQTGCASAVYSLWGSSATDLWAVGPAGALCHSTGDGNWATVDSGTTLDLFTVSGTGPTDIWVGGGMTGMPEQGIALHGP